MNIFLNKNECFLCDNIEFFINIEELININVVNFNYLFVNFELKIK